MHSALGPPLRRNLYFFGQSTRPGWAQSEHSLVLFAHIISPWEKMEGHRRYDHSSGPIQLYSIAHILHGLIDAVDD